MTEHKQAKILRAIADGKKVKYEQDHGQPVTAFLSEITPLSHPHLHWQVLPDSPRKRAWDIVKLSYIGHQPNVFNEGWRAMGRYLISESIIEPQDLPDDD